MVSLIKLPFDGCPAQYNERIREWICPIPSAIPVLEYFTEKALSRMKPGERNVAEYVGRQVVAAISGAEFLGILDEEEYHRAFPMP